MPKKQSDAQRLRELLVENGREHLQVMPDGGALVVVSLGDKGEHVKHFRLVKANKEYQVEYWDQEDWKKVPVVGTLEKVVDQLISSGASRMA